MEKKISLRVSDEDLEIIDSFITRHEFSSRSEFLRKAALEYISRHQTPEKKAQLPARISLPKDIKNSIHYLISLGHYDDWSDALEELVKEGILSQDIDKLEAKYKKFGNVSRTVERIQDVEEMESNEYLQR